MAEQTELFDDSYLAGLAGIQHREMVGRIDPAMDTLPTQKIYCHGCAQTAHPESMITHEGKHYCCVSCRFHNS